MYLAADLPIRLRKIYEKVFCKESHPQGYFAPDAAVALYRMRAARSFFRAIALRMPSGLQLPAALLSYEFRTHKKILPLCIRAVGHLPSGISFSFVSRE